MAKIEALSDVGSLANTTSARAVINDNSEKIEAAFQNTVSRDGSAPNQMEADFDLNDHYLLNVADPVNEADGVNLRSVRPLVQQFADEIVGQAVLGTLQVVNIIATAGQTEIPLPSSPGTVYNAEVFVDGLALVPAIDFTLLGTNIDTIKLTTPLAGGEVVLVRYSEALASGMPDDPALRPDLDSDDPGKGASLVRYVAPGTGGQNMSAQDKLAQHVFAADYGAVGDGVTSDVTALGNAFTRGLARGVPVHLDGTKTYALGNLLTIPAGVQLFTNGATFVDTNGASGNTLLVDVGSGVEIDALDIAVPTTKTRQRCVRVTGTDTKIGRIKVEYADQQVGDDVDDVAVRFTNCTRLNLGSIIVSKHDRSLTFEDVTEVLVNHVSLSSYTRGMYLKNIKNGKFLSGKITVASPNAAITAGHVGVLVESSVTDGTRNLTLEDFNIENAGEHGIRIAGPEQLSNVDIVRPRIKGCGASGIKILGTDTGTPTSRSKRIRIIDAIIEDNGTANSNRCGILAQFCDDVVIAHPMIRKQANANSAHTGIRLTSCTNVHIVHPHAMDAVNYGIWLDGSEGDIDQVLVTGGMVRANGDIGFRANTQTATFRRIHVSDLLCSSNTNFGASFGATGGTALDCEMKLQVAGSTGAIACDTASVYLDGSGAVGTAPLSGVTARNGSRWSDGVTLNIRKAGAWTAL